MRFLILCVLLLLLVAGSAAAADSHPPTAASDNVVVGSGLSESAGTQTVVVRLAERPASSMRATATADQVDSLQTHAVET